MEELSYYVYPSPVGELTIVCSPTHLLQVRFGRVDITGAKQARTALSDRTFLQLNEYFDGKRRTFDLPILPKGTPFQQSVWQALGAIPFGATTTYGDIARQIGSPKAVRAVGMANHNNPIAIIVPCHRVIGKNGSLTGYAGGLEIKQKLLNMEAALLKR